MPISEARVLTSQLFQNDAVLQAIADDNDRMSRHRHSHSESARKVQTALLTWDPTALPRFGADGKYGDETAAAVRRFKIDELGVAPRDVIDDVGPRTVIRLDEIQAAAETPPAPPASTLFIRRDVWTLQAAAPWDPITEAYARAVRTMQARPVTDPTSWEFQAAMHATFRTPANPLWNGCQHASWFFLPWHRMYLFFFEKIVRAAVIANGGPADFALPYWNYDQAAPANTLPLPFREVNPNLPDGTSNPLQLARGLRDPGIAGGAQLRAVDTSSTQAMNTTTFTGGSTAFGGGVSAPALFDGASGQLELQPHNIIHTVIGGVRPRGTSDCSIGQMTSQRCAALDPIFWLHHANIDRLWNRWLDLAGRANPADSAWRTQRFSFADETGAIVSMSVAEVLDSATQLHYVYDDLPSFTLPPPIVVPVAPRTELIGATEEVVAVTDRVTVPLVVPDSNRSLFFDLARGITGVFLSIEDIEAEQNPGVVFDVLLNQPDAGGDPQQHRVGSFSLFGVELMNDPDHPHDGAPGLRHTFDIAEIVNGLAALDLWNPESVTVTIEPVPPPAPPGERQLSIAELDLVPVRVGRISLFAQERSDLVS
jgi:tyrosinase